MNKRLISLVALVLLILSGSAMAQAPMLEQDTKELGLSGALDFQNRGATTLDLVARYGYFIRNNLEVGGVVEFSGNFDDAFRYGLGGFAEYHFPKWIPAHWPRIVPFLGADVSLAFVDSDIEEDNAALIFQPRAGVKWFVRDYFALETHLFFAVATDELFQNKRNDLDPYDVGMRFGIRVYFR